MLTVEIPAAELYDQATQEFINTKPQTLRLEHSLVSLSKWEAKWHKPFLTKADKTDEEMLDYIRMMTITQNVDPGVYDVIPDDVFQQIGNYISNPMTATTFSDRHNRPSREVITAEIIYHWMINFQIPIECQKWHLNRLLTLIKVCSIKNSKNGGKAPKMTKAELMRRNTALNAARREKHNTTG